MTSTANAYTSFVTLVKAQTEQVRIDLGLNTLSFGVTPRDLTQYPSVQVYDLGSGYSLLQGMQMVQLSVRVSEGDDWKAMRIKDLLLEKLGFSYRAQSFRAFTPVQDWVSSDTPANVGQLRVEPVSGQIWNRAWEKDPGLIHFAARLNIYFDGGSC